MISIISPRIVNIRTNKESKVLTAKDNQILNIPNSNLKPLLSLCDEEGVGSQIDVINYCIFDTGSYLINISCMKDFLVNEKQGESIPPKLIYGKSVIKKGDFLVSRNASMGKISYVDRDIKGILNGGISRLRFKEEYKYYAAAFFKSGYVSKYLEVVTSKGGTQQNAKRNDLLEVPIPFPTAINHSDNLIVIKYISFLVKMLLLKEQELRNKNNLIDKLIKEAVFHGSNIQYSYPNIRDVKNLKTKRLDTSYSNYDFKFMVDKISKYKDGWYTLDGNNIKPGTTPDNRIYYDEPNEYTKLWITPKNISKRRLDYKTYILTNESTKIKTNSVIISAVRHLGYSYLADKNDIYSNQNTLIINQSEDRDEQIFLLCYLSSDIGLKLQYAAQITGLVPIIYAGDFKNIPIPKFNCEFKKKVVNLYYNDIERSKHLYEITDINDFKRLEESEKKRNRFIGIYQINNEILRLEELINNYIKLIIENKKIDCFELL